MKTVANILVYTVLAAGAFVMASSCYAGFMDSVTDTLSKTGKSIAKTTEEIVDSAVDTAKAVGKETGIVTDEHNKQAEPATTSAPSEKLPGGVTNRIEKMYKELDTVEKKLTTGVGSPADRAQRAKLDLNRAEGYMQEIEKRYQGQFSPDHPVFVAAVKRLTDVRETWNQALTEAVAVEAEAAQRDKAQQAAEADRQKQLAEQQNRERLEQQASRKAAEAGCDEWSAMLQQFMQGEKVLSAYPTDDQALFAKWRLIFGEARTTVNDYPEGLCPEADSRAKYIRGKLADFDELDKAFSAELAQAQADQGSFLFSRSPIKNADAVAAQDTFTAGDHIYGIIKLTRPLAEIFEKEKNFSVRVNVAIDGTPIHAQFVTITSREYADRNYLVFDIAPQPSELKAYSDPNITYGKSNPTTVQGPNELTDHLGKLQPGSHTMTFDLPYYGKSWASGQLTIEGDDYRHYARLHEAIAGSVVAARTLPPAGMKDERIAESMRSLLKNGGWDNVYRLNITDKDWWIERVNGGNTPVKSRYLAAVALAKKSDGSYFYKKCTFHQDKLITGGFGELYLSHQGEEVPINKENIDK